MAADASTIAPSGTGLMSPEEHAAFARIVREHAGITLGEGKRQLLSSRLQRRMRTLGLASFSGYRRHLLAHLDEELDEFIHAITTNLTAFFREDHHFQFLDRFFRDCPAGSSLRLWSAGCSTGEEAYSMAMVFRESQAARRRVALRILATDVDAHCVELARAGIYEEAAASGLDRSRLAAHCLRGIGRNQGSIRIRPEVRELVRFQVQNLLDPWPALGAFDVVFCRNVVIYFDDASQRMLFDRFADRLKPGGLMVIGHSENLQRVSSRFARLGRTIYRRVDA
ncbi:MAG: CheR family methyltransferase [Pseudomonadales bacterium]